MKRRHGFFLATALGLAAIAGSYAAMQTTDLGAQAATVSENEIAAADVRLDKQEAALRRATKKRPPRLPKLPVRDARPGGAAAGVAPTGVGPTAAAQAPAAPAVTSPGSSGGHDEFDDDAADEYEDHLDELEDAREDAEDDSGGDDD